MGSVIRVIVEGGDAADERRVADILGSAGDVELVSASPSAGGKIDRLTPRELEILALIAGAETNGAIAARLGITTRAVERHVNSIFRKLEIPDDGTVNRRVRAALVYRGA